MPFNVQRFAIEVGLYAIVPVSVRPSHVGVLLKSLNLGLRKQCHTVAQGLYSFLMPNILAKFQRSHSQQRRQIGGGVG